MVLTAVTAILGVLPIAFGMNVEFMPREITVGAPATQWWVSLSTAIVFGLGFATVLTLIVTPAALMRSNAAASPATAGSTGFGLLGQAAARPRPPARANRTRDSGLSTARKAGMEATTHSGISIEFVLSEWLR